MDIGNCHLVNYTIITLRYCDNTSDMPVQCRPMRREKLGDEIGTGRNIKRREKKEKRERESSHLIVRQDDEGTAARRLHDDGKELGIDRAERRVPGGLGHPNVVVALLALQGSSVHVAKLAGAHHAERHVCTCSAIRRSGPGEGGGSLSRGRAGCPTRTGPSAAIILIIAVHASATRAWASRGTSPLFINRLPTFRPSRSLPPSGGTLSLSLCPLVRAKDGHDRNKNIFRTRLGRFSAVCIYVFGARRPRHA